MSVESNIFIPMQSTNQGSIISVRTAGGRMQSIAPSGEYGADFVPQEQVHYSATSATIGCPSPYSVKGKLLSLPSLLRWERELQLKIIYLVGLLR